MNRRIAIINLCMLVLFSTITSALPAHSQDSSAIKVVYPRPKNSIQASSSFIVGQVAPGLDLTCNGANVRVNKSGFFAHVVPLNYGTNHFVLKAANADAAEAIADCDINRALPPKPLSPNELIIVDLKPNLDMGITAGDIINFSARATPFSAVTVQLGSRLITLASARKAEPVKDVAYGKVYESSDIIGADLYKGSYRATAADHFFAVHPQFKLVSSKGELSTTAKISISTVEHFGTARTAKTPTIVRLGPGLARTTPLVEGVKLSFDGWSGDNLRCIYAPNKHVWIKRQDLTIEQEADSKQEWSTDQKNNSPSAVPQTVARTINVIPDDYNDNICLPLGERLPYQVEQKMNPNCLILRLYGVQSDTDWITAEAKENNDNRSILDHISWRQIEDNVYEVTAHLSGKRQWGYQIKYNGTDLCLSLKHAPQLNPNSSLQGLKICLDAGHGGSERGSTGCSGLPESQLNFDITSKVKSSLEQLGATVIMTRNSQDQFVSLDDRVKIATDNQADLFVSIHNNALPDGRDPWKEHGTSSYWYHPQSIELATSLKNSVKQTTGFLDLGARYQNLAIARANAMPAVLLELGFMINPDEFTNLIDPTFQNQMAEAIANGFKQYFYPAAKDAGYAR